MSLFKLNIDETEDDFSITSYGNQDLKPQLTISPDLTQLSLGGNSWKKIDFGGTYTLDKTTLLEFDFQSNYEGEIQSIGFDTDNSLVGSGVHRFQLFGTEKNSRQNFNNYELSQGWKPYQIPVGQFFTGDFNYLTLINDHDVANPTAESLFRNIKLHKAEVALTLGETQETAGVSSYHNQDRDAFVSFSPDKSQIEIDGNGWKKLDLGNGYNITENTILEFEFQSNTEGEIHGIGFDTDNSIVGSGVNRFQLFGTERNGRQNFNNYDPSQGLKSYQIPVGQFFTGDFNYLTLINDHDIANPTAESLFRNIKLYEAADETPPTANLTVENVTETGGNSHTFTVTYSDNQGLDLSTLDSSDLHVLGPNGFDAETTFLLVDNNSNGTPRTATYQIEAPGRTWNAAENGTYTVVLRSDEVGDLNGNFAIGKTLGSFQVDLADDPLPEDTTLPIANLVATNLISGGGTTHTFSVTYSDNVALDVSSLDGNDIRVQGPNDFEVHADFVSVSNGTNGSPRTATYQINAPGSLWDGTDNGTYTITLQPNQVNDTSNNFVVDGNLGTFNVNITDLDEVDRFGIFEKSFTDTGTYSNPYADATATVTFVQPNGQTLEMPIFWDGGDTWKMRFSPDEVGDWSWSITSNDTGLNGQSGTISVVASDNRGSIQAQEDHPYHFQYQDGTPFYWFGDTNWRAGKNDPSENLDRDTVFHYVDVRASQGFNYIHTNFGGGSQGSGNDGGNHWIGTPGEKINPAYFQEIDTRVEYMNSKGITVGFMLEWAQGWDDYPEADRLRYADYIAARYSGYNVTFIVSGEYNETLNAQAYRNIAQELEASDPHDRMISMHATRTVETFANDPWMSFGDYQQQYTDLHNKILSSRDHNKPVVNSEYAYYLRDSNGDGIVDKPNSATLEEIRNATWDIVMAGGYIVTGWGTTYLGGDRDPGPFNPDDPRNDVWEDDVQHVREFFTDLEWWKLEPNDGLVTGPGTEYALAEPGQQYVAYARGGNGVNLSLGNVPVETYHVQRFDPRTGTYTDLPNYTGNGTVSLTTPNNQDWLFVLTKASGSARLASEDETFVGDASNNLIDGGSGDDTLTGGGGSDRFVYNSATEGTDTLTDFGADDLIEISAAGFGGGLVSGVALSEGVASSTGVFVNGLTSIGTSANFLYNSGTLSFDVDGTGPQAAVELASFLEHPALSATQFAVAL
jgi:Protein of unknown function (DUF4038)/Domain of unknown function (DUF5060)/Putative collagen-binding domain of a collagenase/RTX calcium-binding nonapeptide repeat (4 copies)